MRISDWSSDVCSSDLHVLNLILHAQPRTLEVDRDELVEVLLLGIGDFGRRAADSCVVVRAVQPPVALNCRSDEAPDLLAIGNVHLVEECVATHLANGLGNRLALVWIAVGNDCPRAILRKEDGGGLCNTGSGTRTHRNHAFACFCHTYSLSSLLSA